LFQTKVEIEQATMPRHKNARKNASKYGRTYLDDFQSFRSFYRHVLKLPPFWMGTSSTAPVLSSTLQHEKESMNQTAANKIIILINFSKLHDKCKQNLA
jgi:hypothetical protein